MDKLKAIEQISGRGWLATTPEHFRVTVLRNCDLITRRRGETFFNAGDRTGGIYGIAAGRIEIHLPAGIEGATLAHIAGVGHWFGEISAFGGVDRRVTIIAATEIKVLRLSQASMQRVVAQDPDAWMHFSGLLAMNLGLAMSGVTALRYELPVQRIAATLCHLAGPDPGSACRIAVSQSDLGAIAGLSRNTVNIALADLEKQAMVKRHYRQIEIIDRKALRAILDTARP